MENPRIFADKSNPENLSKAIAFSLKNESDSIRKNLQHFNRQRYKAVAEIEDYEVLKDNIRRIKEESIARLPELLEQLKNNITSRGGHYFVASHAEQANEYIRKICKKHGARLVVKSKSMTTEEIKLNDELEKAGIEVAETDLAEFILQVADEHPSHIVVPAIHRTREQIAQLFKEKLNPKEELRTGEQLTMFARHYLRQKFLQADVGITGANVIAADTGTMLLVESEGNIRMTTTVPPVHIAVAGVEKVIARHDDLFNFFEILAPSATGQALTSYTHLLRPPLPIPVLNFTNRNRPKDRSFYLVLIDNGRMAARQDGVLKEALYCIRCSACLNVCPNFQHLGGHAFGGQTYSGGIGAVWEAAVHELNNARFTELCTGCSRCINQCPARIDIPWLNENLRQRLSQQEKDPIGAFIARFLPTEKNDSRAKVQKQILGNISVFSRLMSHAPSLINWFNKQAPVKVVLEKFAGIDRRRPLPQLPAKTFFEQGLLFLEKKEHEQNTVKEFQKFKVLVFSDIFINYNYPQRGMALLRILKSLGFKVHLSEPIDDGRASLSQGLVDTAHKRARNVARYLIPFIEKGYDIVVIEPSVLAMFRRDYKHFLERSEFASIKTHSYEPFEYLTKVFAQKKVEPADYFQAVKNTEIFYHPHCQQKTIKAVQSTIEFLQDLGAKLTLSEVECCGMAGSFGYKKEFYDVSMKVGEQLFGQIGQAQKPVILASGISCTEQISQGVSSAVKHPIEFVSELLKI